MRAIYWERYGSEHLALREVPKPTIGDDGVLVRVRAASVNPVDWRPVGGRPYVLRKMMGGGLRRPRPAVIGVDVAGVVEAVGKDVTLFKPGDEILGTRSGAFAEYVAGRERNFVLKPEKLSFEEAAAIPVAGQTALQAVRDRAGLGPGQHVLINGAAGGVGTFAVQIAKAYGAEVTAVCSTRNVEMVRALGADHVIDYTKKDFTRGGRRFDAMLDIAANRSLLSCTRVLREHGVLVSVGAPEGRWLSPVPRMAAKKILARFVSQKLGFFLSKNSKDDLLELLRLVEAGTVKPVIDRTFPLAEAREAIRYAEGKHARAKVVLTV